MSDVKLVQSNDDGDIFIEAGVVELSPGLETAAYISLFGGDENDDGSQDTPLNWWGNNLEEDTAFQVRSQTQNLIRSIPSIPANLRRIEEAVLADLAWMLEKNVASSVDASVTFDGPGKIKIIIEIKAEGTESSFEFTENWRASV